MKTNQLIVLGIIAVGALGTALLLSGREAAGGGGANRVGVALLPQLEAAVNDIDNIALEREDERLTLERGESGWTIRERDGYAAQVGRVRELLLALADATLLEEKTSNPENYAALGLQTPTAIILGGGSVDEQRLSIGNGARRGTATYVRLGEEARTWLVSGSLSAQADVLSWIEPVILDVPGKRIQSVAITHGDGEIVRLEKASAEDTGYAVLDIPEGKTLAYESIANPIGSTLANLRLEDVRSAAGDDSPLVASIESPAQVRFTTFDGLVIDVQIFSAPQEQEQWLTMTASVDEEQAQRFAPSGDASETDGSPAPEDAPSDGERMRSVAEVTSEAQALNERLAPWVYAVGSYKFEQLTKRMDDLVQDPPPPEAR